MISVGDVVTYVTNGRLLVSRGKEYPTNDRGDGTRNKKYNS